MVPYSTAEELCNVMNIQRGFWTGNESGVVKKVMMIPYIQNKAHELEKKNVGLSSIQKACDQ